MSSTNKLIPAKFLTLIAHLAISSTLIWSLQEGGTNNHLPDFFEGHHSQLILSLSLSLALILFELFAFLTGLTMFHSTSSLLSIGCHGCACIMLSYLIFSGWYSAWFWLIMFSLVPVLNDLVVIAEIIVNKRY